MPNTHPAGISGVLVVRWENVHKDGWGIEITFKAQTIRECDIKSLVVRIIDRQSAIIVFFGIVLPLTVFVWIIFVVTWP